MLMPNALAIYYLSEMYHNLVRLGETPDETAIRQEEITHIHFDAKGSIRAEYATAIHQAIDPILEAEYSKAKLLSQEAEQSPCPMCGQS